MGSWSLVIRKWLMLNTYFATVFTREDVSISQELKSNLSKAHETRDSLSSSYSQVVLI